MARAATSKDRRGPMASERLDPGGEAAGQVEDERAAATATERSRAASSGPSSPLSRPRTSARSLAAPPSAPPGLRTAHGGLVVVADAALHSAEVCVDGLRWPRWRKGEMRRCDVAGGPGPPDGSAARGFRDGQWRARRTPMATGTAEKVAAAAMATAAIATGAHGECAMPTTRASKGAPPLLGMTGTVHGQALDTDFGEESSDPGSAVPAHPGDLGIRQTLTPRGDEQRSSASASPHGSAGQRGRALRRCSCRRRSAARRTIEVRVGRGRLTLRCHTRSSPDGGGIDYALRYAGRCITGSERASCLTPGWTKLLTGSPSSGSGRRSQESVGRSSSCVNGSGRAAPSSTLSAPSPRTRYKQTTSSCTVGSEERSTLGIDIECS